MESIRMTPGSVLASAAKTFIHSVLWVLDYFYSYAAKFASGVPELRTEVLNFTLAFPNGAEQDFQVSKNDYDSYQSKRMRLILDISVLPNGHFQILSATNEPAAETSRNTFNVVKEAVTGYALRTAKVFQLILHELENVIDGEESPPALHENGTGEDRRKLSPKKRLSGSRTRPFRRFMGRVWEILGLSKPSNLCFDSLEVNGDVSFNNCISGPKSKIQEKRKYPSPDDSEESPDDSSENENEAENTPDVGSQEVPTPNEVAMNERGEITEGTEENVLTSNNSSPNGHANHQNVEAKSYLDAEGEDDYVSGEDPDYRPTVRASESSSGSSTGDSNSSMSDDNVETLQKEVDALKSDAAMDVSAINLDHDYHQ